MTIKLKEVFNGKYMYILSSNVKPSHTIKSITGGGEADQINID